MEVAIGVTLPAELLARLQAIAADTGDELNHVIVDAIELHLDELGPAIDDDVLFTPAPGAPAVAS